VREIEPDLPVFRAFSGLADDLAVPGRQGDGGIISL
jgi:hypothetical protein